MTTAIIGEGNITKKAIEVFQKPNPEPLNE
jgi:hypothetical protein